MLFCAFNYLCYILYEGCDWILFDVLHYCVLFNWTLFHSAVVDDFFLFCFVLFCSFFLFFCDIEICSSYAIKYSQFCYVIVIYFYYPLSIYRSVLLYLIQLLFMRVCNYSVIYDIVHY